MDILMLHQYFIYKKVHAYINTIKEVIL